MMKKIAELLDNIFDEKVSKIILRHDNEEYELLFKVVQEISNGYNYFTTEAEKAAKKREAEERKKADEAAKAEAAAFVANKK